MQYTLTCLMLISLLLCGQSCRSSNELPGKYKANGDQSRQIQLVLKSDGRGTWKIDREEASFTWELIGDEVILHSKGGGVIVGKVGKNESIEISLPGMENFRFTRFEK